jgi:hypothetical protein
MSRELYLQQKGIVEKESLNRRVDLQRLIKEHAGIDIDLDGITKKQGRYLYAMVFQRNIEALKNFKN